MTFKTISKKTYNKFMEKKSSFYAYVIPINSEEKFKEEMKKIKKKHKAKHYPYAYKILIKQNGKEEIEKKRSDDGEPSKTAGLPLENIIERNNLINIAIIVARVFGGIKLGTSGLNKAFKTSGKLALEKAEIKNTLTKENKNSTP